MFKYRIISFIALLALFGLITWLGVTPGYGAAGLLLFALVGAAAAALATLELLKMLEKLGLPGLPRLGAGYAALTPALVALGALGSLLRTPEQNYQTPWPIALAVMLAGFIQFLGVPVLAWGLLLFARERREMLVKVIVTVGAVLLVSWVVNSLVGIFRSGVWTFLFFILTTKAGDTGGYIAGKLTGRLPGGNHKVAPSISPAKSWEGLGGGLILSVAVSLIFCACGVVPYLTWPAAVPAGIALYFAGFAGDLTESAVKRACGVKDSGVIMPGMGGVFDVIDSFIYAAPMFLYLWPLVQAA